MVLPTLGMEWRNVKQESEKSENEALGNDDDLKEPRMVLSDVESEV
jgi:hypothetical protein